MIKRSGQLYIDFELPFVIGDNLLWVERVWFATEGSDRRALAGERAFIAEVVSYSGSAWNPDTVELRVTACQTFGNAKPVQPHCYIERVAAKLLDNHPQREEWEDESERILSQEARPALIPA
jgi:hypothetical protein